MDTFVTLSQRLLNRCPQVGILLAGQMVNDAWHTLQARREWSFRRRHGTFAPPTQYSTGYASSNVATGNPTLITGVGTAWTPQMVGSQLRLGGLLYPYYTIVAWISATSILIDQPWAGPDVTLQSYYILKAYYSVPQDFNYFYAVVSIKDGYRLYTEISEAELAIMDPQRTNTGQTYAAAFLDYTPFFGGTIGPVIGVTSATNPVPVSTTTLGYSYTADATYIVQVVTGGLSGTATFQWMRAGQTGFQGIVPTSEDAVDMQDGVQVYWPAGQVYVANDLFVINCQSQVEQGTPRYELWPAPTFNGYLYPYIYISKESDISTASPSLPPFIANRGEVLLEMALAKCATYPGSDMDHPNPYYSLQQARYHEAKVSDLLIDLERNDNEVGDIMISYQNLSFGGPWADGNWQQKHAPFLNG